MKRLFEVCPAARQGNRHQAKRRIEPDISEVTNMTHAHASAGAMRIGGSDAATIMGANRWKTLLQLWQEKTGRKPKDDLSEKESVQWGIKLEPIVLQSVLDSLGLPLEPDKQQVWLEQDQIKIAALD